jgi:cephalosporin hydroxylase
VKKGWLFLRFAITEIKWRVAKCRNIGDYLNLALNFSFFGVSIKPEQVKEELAELLGTLAKRNPKFVLEIGTAWGRHAVLVCKSFRSRRSDNQRR